MKPTLVFSFFLVLMLNAGAGFAQLVPAPHGANLDFEKLDWINPWLNSSNASGLTTFSRILPEFESLANVELTYSRTSGEFRDPVTPPKLTTIGFQTRAVRRINRLFLEGYFNYDLSNRIDAQWNGLYVTSSNPFFMADSIAGRFRSEAFRTGARVAHPVGRNQVIGLGVDYTAGRGAKDRDLRNENRYSNFTIRPSWLLNSGAWTIGATVGWSRVFEDIDYREIATDVAAKWFFLMWGNWFFDASPFTPQTESSRTKKDNIYSGYIQLQYTGQQFSIYNEFGVALKESRQFGDIRFNRQFGDVESTTIQNNLVVHAFKNHRLSVDFRYRYLTGFRPIQVSERDPETLQNIWRTIDRNLIFESIESMQNITYSFLSHRNGSMDIHCQLDVGASLFQREQIYHHSPHKFVQRISSMEFFTAFNKNFRFRRSFLDVHPLVAFRTGSGEKNDTPQTGVGNARQLTAQMEQEFYALTCDRLRLQLTLRYSHPIRNRTSRVFAFVKYDFLKPLGANDIFDNHTRSFMTFGVGILF
ncbi:MAG: hypothetical protein FWC98_01730 [Bacteroidales bacterium]|nr:hypothetical protein [Bacteroidales bacterium]